jgi:hypothetical protein
MASRRRNSSKKSAAKRGRGKRTEKKSHKWHQRGCQSQTGGGSMTGGWAWGPSDVHHQTAGSPAGSDVAPHSINGNHYALNSATVAPPQASNAIVERHAAAQTAGRRRGRRDRRDRRGRRDSKGAKSRRKAVRKSRRIACQNGGGFMEFLPELPRIAGNSALEAPSSIIHGLQGSATAFVSSNPTSQPIGQPIALK